MGYKRQTNTEQPAERIPVQHNNEPIFMISEGSTHDPIEDELIHNHSHLLHGEINYENVGRATQWIIAENLKPVEKKDKKRVLTLYINSMGGDLYNAFALVDMMHASKYPIRTIGIGNVMSAAALILACGTRGHRYLARHTGILMHQFYSDLEGKEHELQAGMRELEFCRKRVHSLLTNYCRISERVIKTRLLKPSDAWLTAEEAVQLKLADKILTTL